MINQNEILPSSSGIIGTRTKPYIITTPITINEEGYNIMYIKEGKKSDDYTDSAQDCDPETANLMNTYANTIKGIYKSRYCNINVVVKMMYLKGSSKMSVNFIDSYMKSLEELDNNLPWKNTLIAERIALKSEFSQEIIMATQKQNEEMMDKYNKSKLMDSIKQEKNYSKSKPIKKDELTHRLCPI